MAREVSYLRGQALLDGLMNAIEAFADRQLRDDIVMAVIECR